MLDLLDVNDESAQGLLGANKIGFYHLSFVLLPLLVVEVSNVVILI